MDKCEVTLRGSTVRIAAQLTRIDPLAVFRTLLEDDDGHIRSIMRQALRDSSSSSPPEEENRTDTGGSIRWTPETMSPFWDKDAPSELKLTPGAKQVLSIIADKASGCSKVELLAELSREENRAVEAKAIGGRLSSVAAIHKAFPDHEKIYRLEAGGTQYIMADHVASIIKQLKSAAT